MTYNVFSGTLNPAQSINQPSGGAKCTEVRLNAGAVTAN